MIDLQSATLEALKQMNDKQIRELGEFMRYDSKKYVSIIFPEILSAKWTDEKKLAFLNGELYQNEIFPEHHLKMYQIFDDLIDGDKRYAANILFRKAAKTTIKRMIATKIIAYAIFNVQLFVSETIDQAKHDTDAIKYYIETNRVLQYLFSNMKGGVWNRGEATFYSQGKELYILCRSMSSKNRGLNHKDNRVGFTFGDDIESPENTATVQSRQEIGDKLENDFMHIGDGNFEHRLLLSGTIVHPECYLAKARHDKRFQEPYGSYYECPISKTDSVKYNEVTKRFDVAPIEAFNIGKPVWPETYNQEYLQYNFDIAAQDGGRNLWRLLQEWWNVPKQDSKALFLADKVTEYKASFYSKMGVTYLEVENNGKKEKIPVDVYTGVDPASGRNDQTDDSTFVTLCRTPDDKFILLDCEHLIIEYQEQLETCLMKLRKFTPRIMRIETIAYQYSLFSGVKSKAREAGLPSLIKDWDHKKGKNTKFKEGLTTLVNMGNLYYITGCRGIDKLKIQLSNFNKHDDNDDLIDGLYLAWVSAGDRLPKKIDIDSHIRTRHLNEDPIEKARLLIEAKKSKGQHWSSTFIQTQR